MSQGFIHHIPPSFQLRYIFAFIKNVFLDSQCLLCTNLLSVLLYMSPYQNFISNKLDLETHLILESFGIKLNSLYLSVYILASELFRVN